MAPDQTFLFKNENVQFSIWFNVIDSLFVSPEPPAPPGDNFIRDRR